MMVYRLVAFISGMAVTVVELAAARLLAPYFGASLFVWTNVIGVILIGLALGYITGGRIADRTKSPQLLFGILGIAGVLVFVAPFLIKVIAPFAIVPGIFTRTAPLVLVVGSFVATIILFLVPTALLGMTSPFLISLASRHDRTQVGEVSGRIFAWSTVGSILGVFCTGILFIPFLGTRATLMGAALVLVATSMLGATRFRLHLVCLVLVLAGVALAADLGPLRAGGTLLFEKESPYQYIRAVELEGSRYLIFNEGNSPQSVWHPNTIATGFYYDYVATLPAYFPKEKPLKILLVGLGGGTIPRQYAALYPERDYTIDAVEIDPAVVAVARRFFELPADRLAVTVADGRPFLTASEKQYDLIILDAFANQYYIPWHLTTQEFFTVVRERLAPNGLVAFNVDAGRRDAPLLQSIVATVSAVFPHVATMPMPNSWNQIVFAREAPIDFTVPRDVQNDFVREHAGYLQEHVAIEMDPSHSAVLTDDKAPVELLTDAMFLRESL